jgi:hypothetical protein
MANESPKKPKPGMSKQQMKDEIRSRVEAASETKQIDRFLIRRDVAASVGVGSLETYLKEFASGFPSQVSSLEKPSKKEVKDITRHRKPVRRKKRGKLK